ncbi:MAG: NAD(P)H-dependent oxidoreductase [Rikenellaceae bacterium]
MKTLIIFAHPNPKSFSAAILERVTTLLTAKNCEYKISDLYDMNFNSVLSSNDFIAMNKGTYSIDIISEMHKINWAEQIVMIYPIWWTGMPAIMKGYIDRVFAKGFAYDYIDDALIGLLSKKVVIINTMGTKNSYYDHSGMTSAMKMTLNDGIIEMCGMKTKHHLLLGNVPSASSEERQQMLLKIDKLF